MSMLSPEKKLQDIQKRFLIDAIQLDIMWNYWFKNKCLFSETILNFNFIVI